MRMSRSTRVRLSLPGDYNAGQPHVLEPSEGSALTECRSGIGGGISGSGS